MQQTDDLLNKKNASLANEKMNSNDSTESNESILRTLSSLSIILEKSGNKYLRQIDPRTFSALDILSPDDKRRSAPIKPILFSQEEMSKATKQDEQVAHIIKQLDKVAQYLFLTRVQTLLFIAAFSRLSQTDNFEWEDMPRFFSVKSIAMLPLKKDFEKLVEDKYFFVEDSRPFGRTQYQISPRLMESVMTEQPFKRDDLIDQACDRYKFVKEISKNIDKRSEDRITSSQLMKTTEKLEAAHGELKFVQNVLKLNLDISDRVLFYELCKLFMDDDESSINRLLIDIYEHPSERFRVAHLLKNEQHILQKLDLIELGPAVMFDGATLQLTEKGKELFLEDDFELFSDTTVREKGILAPDQIKEKKLFYSDELERQLRLFRQNLEEERFVEIQKRLDEKALPKGVIALFHGLPGTGKTESALQIARATGRAVCHVDISAAKTCWYGESQKLIKRIFTNYKRICEKEKLKPILLFNEADALFTRRMDLSGVNGSSSVAQTENAIQNIILEEMEKLDGIMIATTNMIDNLDSAFARRFLFKIKFGQPTVEAKKAIWHDKLEWLSEEECTHLAQRFDFSGGEIDNIVRKVTMSEVLDGVRPDLAGIEELCRHEKIDGKNSSENIGFKRA